MTDQSFTAVQMAQLKLAIKEGVEEAFADSGLRIDEDHQDEARRDFMFVRSLRQGINGTASKIGFAVILAALGGLIWLLNMGVTAWRGMP